MKPGLFCLCLLLVIISLSCIKDDLSITGKSDGSLISKVKSADKPYYEYLFNNENFIIEEKGKYNFTKFSYNDKGQMVASDYYSDEALLSNDMKVLENALNPVGLIKNISASTESTVNYEYNVNGQLLKTVVSRSLTASSEYSEFRYDENERIVRQTLFWDNKVLGYIDYLYDDRGNLIKETLYSISPAGLAELSTSTRYEFDNYKNPFRSLSTLMIPGINTNINNIIKETYTIHYKSGEGTDIVETTLNTYTYNSKGYPVRKNGTIAYFYE